MVNHDASESLLDRLILQIFEDQEDAFSFPLTTMKQTRDFVRLLNRQGFSYEMICAEIEEKFEAFRSWRLGGGPDTIGRRMMMRINKPLQEAMLSDGGEEDEEEEEAQRNGTTEGKGTTGGGARRKKSLDGGGARRGSRSDKVDGGKKGKIKEAKVSDEALAVEVHSEEKDDVKGQQRTAETGVSEKMDTTDGKKVPLACGKHSKPSALNNDLQPPNSGKPENGTKVAEKRDDRAKDAAPNNSVKTSDGDVTKENRGGQKTVKEDFGETTKTHVNAKKDVGKEREKTTDVPKEQKAEVEKKELETSTGTKQKEQKAGVEKKELETSTGTKQKEQKAEVEKNELGTSTRTKQKEQEADAEAKQVRAEPEPKSPGVSASKPDEKLQSNSTDSKKANAATKNEQRPSTENRKESDTRAEKATAGSPTTPPSTNRIPAKPSDAASLEKPSAEEGPGPQNQARTSSPTQSSKQGPVSPPFKPGPPATESRQIPEVQTQSNKDKNATENLSNTKTAGAETPSKVSEAVYPPTKEPRGNAAATSLTDSAKPKEKNVGQNDSKLLPVESKFSPISENDKAVPKSPEKETTASSTMLTVDNHVMAKPASVIRSKSETVELNLSGTPTPSNLIRASSDSADSFRPSATTPAPLKRDLQATKMPPSDANHPEIDENYDSDLDDSETSDRLAEDRVLIERLHSLKRNDTKDGPGHLFIFSDTPAATGTGKHRVRIGISRFPEKRLQQAQLFNPDIRMVTTVAVATRRDALSRAQEELKSMSLRGKRGWFWGSLDAILEVVTNLSVKNEAIE